jgi:hypothetical protein
MVRNRPATVAVAILLGFPVTYARPAQEPSSTQKQEKSDAARSKDDKEQREELEKKAVHLLDEVLKEAQGLRLPENRIRLQAQAADILWKHDEPRARALLKAAVNSLIELQRTEGDLIPPDAFSSGSPDQYQLQALTMQARAQVRQEVLTTVARRDAKLARDFLAACASDKGPPGRESQSNWVDQQLEAQVVVELASTEPDAAAKMALESLEKGMNYAMPGVVGQLLSKDKDAGNKLAAEIVARLRSQDLTRSGAAVGVALSLLDVAVGRGPALPDKQGEVPRLDERITRELMEIVIAAALKGPPPARDAESAGEDDAPEDYEEITTESLVQVLGAMLPEVERYAPTRYAAVKARLDERDKKLGPKARAAMEYERLAESGSIDSILAAAEKAPEDEKEMLYSRAAMLAGTAGDSARAAQILEEHVPDENSRKQVLGSISQQAVFQAAQQGKIDQARPVLSRMQPAARANALLPFASAALGKGDKKLCAQLLEEARGLIGTVAGNGGELQTVISIASTYASFDPSISLEMLDGIIDQLNTLIGALAVVDGFEGRRFREGELMAQPSSQVVMQLMQCAGSLSGLARSNFDRARVTADRFQRLELRLAGRMAIAQGILGDRTQGAAPVIQPPALYPMGLYK